MLPQLSDGTYSTTEAAQTEKRERARECESARVRNLEPRNAPQIPTHQTRISANRVPGKSPLNSPTSSLRPPPPSAASFRRRHSLLSQGAARVPREAARHPPAYAHAEPQTVKAALAPPALFEPGDDVAILTPSSFHVVTRTHRGDDDGAAKHSGA